MALPSRFDPEEFQRTMEALRDGTSAADMVARPEFDAAQARNFVEDAQHGRRIEQYRSALERGGFTYWPKGAIPPGCEARSPFEPPRPLLVGQWRRPADRKLPKPLALTDAQVVAWFATPEELWSWLKDLATVERRRLQRQDAQPKRLFMHR